MTKEEPEKNYEECSGYCWGCEKFAEEQKELEKNRPKESEDEEKLDKLVKEMKEKEKQEKEQYQRKKPRK